jgi:hypothetical protein
VLEVCRLASPTAAAASRLDFPNDSVARLKMTTPGGHAAASEVPGRLDCVYFLMFPGWENELRGNRWHFAVRWAKRLPVILVQPTLAFRSAVSEPEPRIPNARVLRIRSTVYQEDIAYTVQAQVTQVLKDMAEHDFHRPLLWQYNPSLAGLSARLPAVARVYHASEAHFLYIGLKPFFLLQMRSALKMSDLTVAVSAGVADSISARVPEARIATVTNGCDFNAYSRGKPDAELLSAASRYHRVAIYAGNINTRLDFNLIDQLAASHPDVLFAMYGRVADLREDTGIWKRTLRRDNVLAPGAIDPDRLPDVYAASDVGIIPYKQEPLLVEAGRPLKALEMCATGLPVVSTLMQPLQGVARGLLVTSSRNDFLDAFARTSRSNLSAEDGAELRQVSAAHDYDVKFDDVLKELDQIISDSQSPTTKVDIFIAELGALWQEGELHFFRLVRIRLADVVREVARVLPPFARRRLLRGGNRAAIKRFFRIGRGT